MNAKHIPQQPEPSAANDDTEGRSRLVRMPVVLDRTGLSRSALYRLIADDDFPQPVKLTERSTAWVEGEVDDWIANRVRQRRA